MYNLQTRHVPSLFAKRMGEFTLQISYVFTILRQMPSLCYIHCVNTRKKTNSFLSDSNTLSRFKLFTDQICKVILQMSVCKLHLHSPTKHHILHNWHYIRPGSYVSFKIWIVCSLTTQVDWPIVWQLQKKT